MRRKTTARSTSPTPSRPSRGGRRRDKDQGHPARGESDHGGRGRGLALGSTAAVVIFVVTLLVVEGALRAYHHFHPSFVFSDGSYNRFRGRPFADDYDFKLNSRGFKDLERRTEKPPGAYRILVVGDSFVFGVVPHRHNFTTVLERDLNDPPPGGGRPARFEVINMGIPDTGPREYLAILIDEGPAFSPDLVIVCVFFGDDLQPVKKALYERSYVASLVMALLQARHFPGLIVHGPGVYRDDAASYSPETYMELVVARSRIYVEGNPGLPRGLSDAVAYLTRIRDVCRERRIELLVAGFPDEVQVDVDLQREVVRRLGVETSRIDFTAPNRALAEELRGRGIRYLDLLPAFRESAATPLYEPRDSHWNIAGNRRAAKTMAAHVLVPSRRTGGGRRAKAGGVGLYLDAMSGVSVSGERKETADGIRAAGARQPRWYWHGYNRAHLYRLAEALGRLPRRVRLGLAGRVGAIASPLFPAERAAIRRTLELTTGASGARLDRLTAAVFRDFARCFSDLVSTNRRPAGELLTYVGSVSGAGALEGLTGGVISVTAHVGNWEMAGRVLANHSARRTHVVVAPEEVPALERWVRRDGDGMRFVPRTHPGIGIEMLAALRRGEVVALQGDRALGTRGDLPIPFFGRPAPFPVGPFVLARAARVPIVPAFCMLDGASRYALRIEAPIRVTAGEEEAAASAWVAMLEGVVREYPTQWFNFFDVWRPFP